MASDFSTTYLRRSNKLRIPFLEVGQRSVGGRGSRAGYGTTAASGGPIAGRRRQDSDELALRDRSLPPVRAFLVTPADSRAWSARRGPCKPTAEGAQRDA